MSRVHLEGVQNRRETVNLRDCRLLARLLGAAAEFRHHDGRQNAEDDQHEQQFDQGEACPRITAGETGGENVSGFIFMIRVSGSFDMFLQGENRNDHPDEDGPDKSGDEEKHQRLGKRNGGFQLPIQVAFRDIGDADQFLIEFAAFFRDGYHFEHRAAE